MVLPGMSGIGSLLLCLFWASQLGGRREPKPGDAASLKSGD